MRIRFKTSVFHEYFVVTSTKLTTRDTDHVYPSAISDCTYYYYIREDIYKWCKSLNIEYSINFNHDEVIKSQSFWFIEIPNDSEAVLFKLTWM